MSSVRSDLASSQRTVQELRDRLTLAMNEIAKLRQEKEKENAEIKDQVRLQGTNGRKEEERITTERSQRNRGHARVRFPNAKSRNVSMLYVNFSVSFRVCFLVLLLLFVLLAHLLTLCWCLLSASS